MRLNTIICTELVEQIELEDFERRKNLLINSIMIYQI